MGTDADRRAEARMEDIDERLERQGVSCGACGHRWVPGRQCCPVCGGAIAEGLVGVEFTCTAQATIREHWRCDVPREVIVEGADAVHDYLLDREREWDINGADETLGGEEDRTVERESIETALRDLSGSSA